MSKYEHLVADFIRDYENGESIRAIALKYGVAKGTVSHLIRNKVVMRPKSVVYTLSEEEQQAICKAYLQGNNVNTIAKDYGTSAGTIKKLLSVKYGITVETTRKYENLVPYIIEDYKKGLSLSAISEKYKISRQCALSYINLEGEEARNYSESSLQASTDITYFDKLDRERAYTLGLMYARATALTFNTSKFLHVLVKEDETDKILSIVNRFVSKTQDNLNRCDKSSSKTVRICSVELHDKLVGLGLGEKLPSRSYLGKYDKDFLDGLFAFSTKPLGKVLRVVCKDCYKPSIKQYLDSIDVGYWSNDFVIGGKGDIVKLLKAHPSIIDNVVKYTKSCPNDKLKARWLEILNQLQ